MEAPGVDTRRLTEVQRTSFFQIINTEASACGKPHSLAKSIKDDATCRDSLVVGQFIADSLAVLRGILAAERHRGSRQTGMAEFARLLQLGRTGKG